MNVLDTESFLPVTKCNMPFELIFKRYYSTQQLYEDYYVMTSLSISDLSCFSLGGIGFTLLIGLIYYKVALRKKQKEDKIEKAEEGNGTIANPPDISEWRKYINMDNSLAFDQQVMTLDPRTHYPVDQLDSRNKNDQLWFSNCHTEDHRGIRQNHTRWNNRPNSQIKTDKTERRRMRIITENDLRMFATQRGILEFTNNLSHSRTSFHPRKEAVVRRVAALVNNQEEGHGYKTEGGGSSKITEALYCKSCCRTYKPNLEKGRVHAKMKDYGLFSDFPCQHREIVRDLNFGNTFDISKDIHLRRKTRNITFNPERLRNSPQQSEDEMTSRDEEAAGYYNSKVQLRRLKMKINLNQKCKVHPKKKSEQGTLGRCRSKKRKGKKVTGKDRGKTKERHQKTKNFAMMKGLAEDGEEQKKENGQVGQKTTKTSTMGPAMPENTAMDQCAKETAQSVDNNNTVDQLPSDSQHLPNESIQHHGTTPNLSTSVDSGLSPQGGSLLHHTAATGSSSLFAGWIANSIPPSTAISASSVAPIGAPGTFNVQEDLFPSTGFLPANILQSSSIYTTPLLATHQKDFLISTMKSNTFQSPLPPPGSSPTVEKIQSDPTPVPGPQPGTEVDQLPHQNTENLLPKQESLCRAPAMRQSVEPENRDGPDLTEGHPLSGSGVSMQTGPVASASANTMHTVLFAGTDEKASKVLQQQEHLSEEGSSNLKRKLRLVLPEKMSSRPLTALERKIR